MEREAKLQMGMEPAQVYPPGSDGTHCGMRRDRQIQGIRNDFTIAVYETHARLALEEVRCRPLS